jgi:hypothetical protein
MMPEFPRPVWHEKHYTPKELGAIWRMSHDVILDIFENEPGVLRMCKPHRRGVQVRHTTRIPASVATRVYNRRKN